MFYEGTHALRERESLFPMRQCDDLLTAGAFRPVQIDTLAATSQNAIVLDGFGQLLGWDGPVAKNYFLMLC